ncbi:MAG: site-specific integrase [Sporichthyaceae bacterium]|nr:site-specific integrase [Sporichthyaceae bacterium]
MRGSTFQRCGCRDATGRQLGADCPQRSRRGHGSWWIRYDAPRDTDGQRRQASAGPFDSRREAEVALADVLDRRHKGTYVAADRGLTFARYLDEWMAGKLALKASTRTSYDHHIALYLKPGLGHVALADLRDTDFEELYAAMRQIGRPQAGNPSPMLARLLGARTTTKQARRPLTPNRVRSVHATVRSALNAAVKRHKIAHNPALYVELERVRLPRALVWTDERVTEWRRAGRRPSPVMVWTPVQTGAFLDAVADDRLYALWHLLAFRGLRRSEAVWLSWVDVDLDAATATVRSGSQQDWDGPKSEASERAVALDPGTVVVLRRHRKAQKETRLLWGAGWIETGLVFTHEDGRALSPNGVSQRFDRLVTRHGVPPIRLHDLRHVAATLALTAGADIKVVSEQLGHSTTQITRDIYLSVMPQVAQAAADAAATLVPRAVATTLAQQSVHTLCTPGDISGTQNDLKESKTAGQKVWGGRDSNPRPRDYEHFRSERCAVTRARRGKRERARPGYSSVESLPSPGWGKVVPPTPTLRWRQRLVSRAVLCRVHHRTA